MHELHPIQLEPIVRRALEEDWGYGDWTTDLCVDAKVTGRAVIIAKEPTLVAGENVAQAVFLAVDPNLNVTILKKSGEACQVGDAILEVRGSARSIMKAERVALNFLGRLTGIATMTRTFVNELEGTSVQLLDTRKTTPGLRILEKSATVIGGARNHRFGLCDGVIVKENHIRAAGGIKRAVERLLESLSPTLKIEVETTTLEEVQEALDAGADLIMLDNMGVAEMTMAVRMVRGRAMLEASGNVRLDRLRTIAETGVNFVSTSAILHSSRWSDLSLQFYLDA